MSYEIKFKYHTRTDSGYDKEITKELIKKIGKNLEEIPLNKAASYILSQLARRDIFIFDYEIYEYKKHKLTSKETNGGIIIKGKKFTFDGNVVDVEVFDDENTEDIPPHNIPINRKSSNNVAQKPSKVGNRKPKRMVVLDSDPPVIARVRGFGLKFTENKEYAVYEEKHGKAFGDVKYLMIDDSGKEDYFNGNFFLQANIRYERDDSRNDSFDSKPTINGVRTPKLMFEDEITEMELPEIRRI